MESPDKKVKTPKLPKEKKPKAPPNPKVSKNGSVIRVRLDQEGNRIIATDKGNVITLALKLKSEKRRRQIGQITKSTRTLHLIRKRDGGHLHILSNSYGFNYTIIEIAQTFDFISIQDEYKRWKITREDLLSIKNFLFFKNQGFELQTFISLDKLDELTEKYRSEYNRQPLKPIF